MTMGGRTVRRCSLPPCCTGACLSVNLAVRASSLPLFYLLGDLFSDATSAYVVCFAGTAIVGTVGMLWTGFLRVFAWIGVPQSCLD